LKHGATFAAFAGANKTTLAALVHKCVPINQATSKDHATSLTSFALVLPARHECRISDLPLSKLGAPVQYDYFLTASLHAVSCRRGLRRCCCLRPAGSRCLHIAAALADRVSQPSPTTSHCQTRQPESIIRLTPEQTMKHDSPRSHRPTVKCSGSLVLLQSCSNLHRDVHDVLLGMQLATILNRHRTGIVATSISLSCPDDATLRQSINPAGPGSSAILYLLDVRAVNS